MNEREKLEAVEYASMQLDPTRMHLAPALEEIYAQAVKAWDDHAKDQAHVLLQNGIEVAQQTGWI